MGNLGENEIAQQVTVSGRDKYNEEVRKSSVIFLEPSEKTQWKYERISALAVNCNAQRYGFNLNGSEHHAHRILDCQINPRLLAQVEYALSS